MTITVTEDIIEGQAAAITSNGPTATRVFRAQTDASETMMEILADASIPQYFDSYPDTGGTGQFIDIFALEISVEPTDRQNNIYNVTVQYARPDAIEKEAGETADDSLIQVGSSVTSEETQVDKDGNQLVIQLTNEPDQNGSVDIQVPETVLLFERKEGSSPLSKSIANTGKVNSASLGSGTYAAKTLLCLGIEGVSSDNGDTWQVTYRFQYKPGTWNAEAVYEDPETGRIHEDVDLSSAANSTNGWIDKEIYSEADFSNLNLPF